MLKRKTLIKRYNICIIYKRKVSDFCILRLKFEDKVISNVMGLGNAY